MKSDGAMVVCTFGWGSVFRLYREYLEVDGTGYALAKLTYVRPMYREVLGIPSARLELRFGKKKLVLPGIAAVKDAEKVAEYLSMWLKEGDVSVPVRLLPDECAYYMTEATLCGERTEGSSCSSYPMLDQGMLILTSRRMIYLGRKGQVMLDYECLGQVELLDGALALGADHWSQRGIFAMHRPVGCAMCLEYVLQRLE